MREGDSWMAWQGLKLQNHCPSGSNVVWYWSQGELLTEGVSGNRSSVTTAARKAASSRSWQVKLQLHHLLSVHLPSRSRPLQLIFTTTATLGYLKISLHTFSRNFAGIYCPLPSYS